MKLWVILGLIFIISGLMGQEIEPERVLELAKTRQELMQSERENFARSFAKLKTYGLLDSADFDQFYYDLDFTFTYSPNNLQGNVTGFFKSQVNGLTEVKLNFDSREDNP
ncbi:MAG: hypothetical protein KAT07_10205, partial [Calditrichia bacterium]|nr:hypothetical protein [Calditrichia bacterium]